MSVSRIIGMSVALLMLGYISSVYESASLIFVSVSSILSMSTPVFIAYNRCLSPNMYVAITTPSLGKVRNELVRDESGWSLFAEREIKCIVD